jgi:hypothetical protein
MSFLELRKVTKRYGEGAAEVTAVRTSTYPWRRASSWP